MRIGIVGAGFTGLVAGLELAKAGHKVVIFEKEKQVGGLASDFRPDGWQWGLEKYYHHIFSGDKEIIALAKEVGWPAFFKKPVTNSLIGGEEKQLDSALSLLKFSNISLLSRMHMGVGLLVLKMMRQNLQGSDPPSARWPKGLAAVAAPFRVRPSLERYRVVEVLPRLVGKEGYKKVWEPLLVAKFGSFLPKVNMAWFWARVYKRTASLGYFEGGFGRLAEKIAEEIKKLGGEVKLNTEYKNNKGFDKILDTTVSPPRFAAGATQPRGRDLPSFAGVDYLWGQTLVLELDKKLMKGYWLNVLEKEWPFLVAVEQTNFINKKYYGGKHVVYLGNYLEDKDKKLKMSEEELLKLYLPYIKKINPEFNKKWIKRKWKFQSPYAQPVFPVNYSKQIPKIKTKIKNFYVANMSMVYPWDRGVNFAVELGQKAAKVMMLDR